MADRRWPVLCPAPVHVLGQVLGDAADLRVGPVVGVEVLGRMQHAGQQQGGVHRRQLAGAETVAGVDVDEVVEKAAMAGRAAWLGALRRILEEAQGVERQLTGLFARGPALAGRDHMGAERKAHRRDAGEAFSRPAVGRQPGGQRRGVAEVGKGALLQVVQQRGVAAGQGLIAGHRRARCVDGRACRTARHRAGQGAGQPGPARELEGRRIQGRFHVKTPTQRGCCVGAPAGVRRCSAATVSPCASSCRCRCVCRCRGCRHR